MDDITNTLNQVVFTLYEQPFTVGGLLFTPILLFVGIMLTKWLVNKLVTRLIANGANADIVHLVRRITYILAIVVITITTLDLLNVPITAFAFLSGAIAIGVGFGAQNIINNFISGWILMWERPIRIGDFLEVENARGRVESINTRSTRIRRIDGVHMLIPNSKLLENTVVNWTLIDTLTRTMVKVGVAYGSPAKKVKELIHQAVTEQDDILKDPAPVVLFEDFGDSALLFETYFWINATVDRDLRVVRSNVRFAIDELFAEHGIVIAFPQRDIHLDGQLQLVSQEDSKQHKDLT
ncbi:mechanosensitive ion channel family protein [Paraglaciecola marina]|uniref:mechanosensitive ion channel family protein n=1 Tax=Paraglaciecola marina TaxID=2500157 RepID=UPI00105F0B5F|nr:mechanosensitive ion channel domain-containing protein [Paraglaciecola marina]